MLTFDPSSATRAIAERCGGAAAPVVGWCDGGDPVLVHLESLRVADRDGWSVCDLDLETRPAGRRHVRFSFHVGVNGLGDRVRASAVLRGSGSPLVDRCAADVEAALWEVLP